MQVAYCEEQVECRRVLLLSHFGESGFTAAACHRTCDICLRNEGQVFTQRDMTQAAHELIRVLLRPPPSPSRCCFWCCQTLASANASVQRAAGVPSTWELNACLLIMLRWLVLLTLCCSGTESLLLYCSLDVKEYSIATWSVVCYCPCRQCRSCCTLWANAVGSPVLMYARWGGVGCRTSMHGGCRLCKLAAAIIP